MCWCAVKKLLNQSINAMLCLLHVAGTPRSILVMSVWKTKEPPVTWIHCCRHCSSPTSCERQVQHAMLILRQYVWFVCYCCLIINAWISVNIASVSTLLTDLSLIPSVGLCVFMSVCPESVLWQNGRVDPDAIWDDEWGQSVLPFCKVK